MKELGYKIRRFFRWLFNLGKPDQYVWFELYGEELDEKKFPALWKFWFTSPIANLDRKCRFFEICATYKSVKPGDKKYDITAVVPQRFLEAFWYDSIYTPGNGFLRHIGCPSNPPKAKYGFFPRYTEENYGYKRDTGYDYWNMYEDQYL